MRKLGALLLASLLLCACGDETDSDVDPTATEAEAPGAEAQASNCVENPSACMDHN
ncbi:Hypothetical protein A7982_02057 [Minicystis rosea]|nr:Hypothetical protein A7982_02057 [Minicystis rosea]